MTTNTDPPRDPGSRGIVIDQGDENLEALLERMRREPALRSWVLAAPTGVLASLGVALDDNDVVTLLDQIEEMDERPLPVAVRDIMTRDPKTVTPDATLHEAAELMAQHRISGLPVCEPGGNVVGMVSEYDLIARSGRSVGDAMSHDVVSVHERAPIDTLRTIFVGRRLKRVPVVNDAGRLVGIVTRADLVRELAYRWRCARCGNMVRAHRPPEGCGRCGAAGAFEPAPPPPALSACPTCGRALDG